MYLNLFSRYFSSIDEAIPQAKIIIEIDGIEYLFAADILQGNQRLLLPPEAQDLIIQAFLNDQCVTISTDRQSEEFPPKNFAHLYQAFRV